MSGHSRWAQIKHKKAGADAKRGALFSKLGRFIAVAARDGGTDPNVNARLRQAMEQAREAGMPKENIERAIARAKSTADTGALQPLEYEAYGPGGSAYLLWGLTDNSNRTTNEIKHILSERGGRLAPAGSVTWLFLRKVVLEFTIQEGSNEDLELALIDAGAEDTGKSQTCFQALVPPEKLESFLNAVSARSLVPVRTTFVAVPKQTIALDGNTYEMAKALAETLEEHNDINEVWTNFDSGGI